MITFRFLIDRVTFRLPPAPAPPGGCHFPRRHLSVKEADGGGCRGDCHRLYTWQKVLKHTRLRVCVRLSRGSGLSLSICCRLLRSAPGLQLCTEADEDEDDDDDDDDAAGETITLKPDL